MAIASYGVSFPALQSVHNLCRPAAEIALRDQMRERRGLTETQVAERLGMSVARVSQIENGDVFPLVRSRTVRIAE